MRLILILLCALIILVGCDSQPRVQEGALGVCYDIVDKITMQVADDLVILKDCENVTSDFVLPEAFCDGTKFNNLGDHSFNYNETVVILTIPDGYESIGHYAFMGCPNLEIVYLGKDVTYIGNLAFTECPKLVRFEVSPDNKYYYEKDGCILEKNSNKLIATNGNIPEGVNQIGDCVFAGNTKISEINIPDGVKNIGGLAFDRSSLISVVLPNSITEIDNAAFSQCTQLKEIYIPDAEKLGARIFYGIDGITINCESASKPEGWDDQWLEGCTNYTINWDATRE